MSESNATPEPSVIAGRYEVLSKLGAGAFGTVYKAKDKLLGRLIAVKTIRLDGLAAQGASLNELLDRFEREARVSAQLKHPNIVTIYDIGKEGGLSYLAMEFIDGVGLDKIIANEGRLPVSRAAAVAAQIADALDYAHRHQVVHRDIKPANVMIEEGDRVKVTDFGIAKTLDSAEHLTVTGSLLGTPSYMSPEQARGTAIDGRTDLFALGCILYEMLAGARAFRGESITALIFKIITEEPPALRELDATLPEGLLSVVQRALSKAPETRYQSGQELLADLQPFVTPGGTPTLRHVETPTRIKRDDETRVTEPPRRIPASEPPTRLAAGAAVAAPTQASSPPSPRQPIPRPGASRPSQRSTLGLILGLAVLGVVFVVAAGAVGWILLRPKPEPGPAPVSTADQIPRGESRPSPEGPPERATDEAAAAPVTQPVSPPSSEVPLEGRAQGTAAPVRSAPSRSNPGSTQPRGGSAEPPRATPPPAQADRFAFLAHPPEEGVDGAESGRRLADAYSSQGGGQRGSSYGTQRQLRRRSPIPRHRPAERAAVYTVHNLAIIENAFRRRTGRYGTLAEILSPAESLPAGTSSFTRQGYSFSIALQQDAFVVNATPTGEGLRGFFADDSTIVQVAD